MPVVPTTAYTPAEDALNLARALAQDLLGAAQMATEKLIARYVRPEQGRGRRRLPYGYRRHIVYL